MRRALALGAAIASLLATRVVLANEADTYGLGSRAAAMGSAVAADAPDFSANYYNPAALVGAPGLELSIGYVYAANQLAINNQNSGVANVHGIVGGLVAPGTFFKIPFAFGIGTYLPDSGLSRVDALRQETPRWALYDERASILFLAANLAVRPFPWLEIGGGAAFLAATHGTFQITGTADIVNPYNSQLQHQVDADLTSVRYPQFGARVKVQDLGYLAFAYRGETKIDLSIAAHLKGAVSVGGLSVPLTYDLTSNTVDAFLPQQFVLGFSFQRIEHLHVNFDLTLVNWAAYESPTAVTSATLNATVPAGIPLTIPASPKPTQIVPPNFMNRAVPHFGVEYKVPVSGEMKRDEAGRASSRAVEVPLRAGYVYEQSPVPPQTGITNFVDADRHTLSIGSGVAVSRPTTWFTGSLALDVHGQLSILPERVTQKDNPADFVGDYRASGSMLGIGSTLTATF